MPPGIVYIMKRYWPVQVDQTASSNTPSPLGPSIEKACKLIETKFVTREGSASVIDDVTPLNTKEPRRTSQEILLAPSMSLRVFATVARRRRMVTEPQPLHLLPTKWECAMEHLLFGGRNLVFGSWVRPFN